MSGRGEALRRVYWVVSSPEGRGLWPDGVMGRLMPMLNHLTDLYLIFEDPDQDRGQLVELLGEMSGFLRRWGFCRVNLRPVHPVRSDLGGAVEDLYRDMFRLGRPFHEEAMAHQTASRWMVLPVLRVASGIELEEADRLARFLRNRAMVPSWYIPGTPEVRKWAKGIPPEGERLLVEGPDGLVATLLDNDLFDDLLNWALSAAGGFSLASCPGVVVDTVSGVVRRCMKSEPVDYEKLERILTNDPLEMCRPCWDALPGRVGETLWWNHREEEGARIRHQLGVFALSRGDLSRAQAHFQDILGRVVSTGLEGESLLYQGILHLERREIKEAHRALRRARDLLPGSSAVLYHLGRCEFEMRDYLEASDLFKEALELDVPGDTIRELLLYLGIAHIQLGEFQEALDALEKSSGDRASEIFYRAMAHLGLGRTQRALEGFREALDRGPDPEDLASIHFYIAHCLKETGLLEEAVDHLKRALESDPASYEAWNLLAYCLFHLKRYGDSIKALGKCLEIDPNSAIDHASMGSNYREMGGFEEAARWYKRALELDPTIGFAVENLKKLESLKSGK